MPRSPASPPAAWEPDPPCLAASATRLAADMRAGRLTVREVVEAHIARIEAVNPKLNAVVANRFEAARAEADVAQARIDAAQPGDTLPPFVGVPCTIKELYAVQGMPNTGGLVSRRFSRAVTDAEAVRRLRQAGAIILGVTNVPEGGMWTETYNRVYGRTNNPWDTRRTAGGSSGGEAAIIASGGSPFGLASDAGGSIRIPAAFCGVVGHKPTGRLVPNTGCWPGFEGETSAYLCTGPMCRRVEDLWPLLRVLAGPDGTDRILQDWALGDPAKVDMKDVVVYPWRTGRVSAVRPAVRRAMNQALDHLARAGARIEDRPMPSLRRAAAIWSAMITAAPSMTYSQVLSQGEPWELWRELIKLPLRRTPHTSVALATSAAEKLFERISRRSAVRRNWSQAGRALQGELEDLLGPNGVLLYPPYSRVAPFHRGAMFTPLDFAFAALFNVLEFPVTSVPVGFTRAGLPVGVQLAARRGNDHLTVAVAQVLEQATGGWVCAQPQAQKSRAWLSFVGLGASPTAHRL